MSVIEENTYQLNGMHKNKEIGTPNLNTALNIQFGTHCIFMHLSLAFSFIHEAVERAPPTCRGPTIRTVPIHKTHSSTLFPNFLRSAHNVQAPYANDLCLICCPQRECGFIITPHSGYNVFRGRLFAVAHRWDPRYNKRDTLLRT